MATDVGSAVGYLDLDIKGFLSGLKTAQSEASVAGTNLATKFGDSMTSMGSSISAVGSSLTKYITVPLAAVAGVGLKVAIDFEKNMSKVKAISGATTEDFKALREEAIDLGASTAFSATEVADAMSEMAKAGWNSNQILDGMSGVLDAAAASGESLASVSTIVADAITGFGLAAKDSTRVADLLTQAANSGTIGITDLGETYKYIAPVAKTMGLSIEDVTVAIAAMSKAGIKGSQAGTSMRDWLTNLVKPSDAVAQAMKELKINITNADGTFKPLSQDVDELRTIFSKLTDEQKTYYAATIAGKEGMSGMLSMLGLTKEEYDGIAKSMYGVSGVAKTTAEVMQDNLGNKIEQLKGSLESLAIRFGDYVIPSIQKFVIKITDLIDKFTKLDPEIQKNILKWVGIAAVTGPVLIGFGKIISVGGGVISTIGKMPAAVSAASTGLKAFSAGVSSFTSGSAALGATTAATGAATTSFAAALGAVIIPILAIVAAIAVLVGVFVTLWKTNDTFRESIIGTWNTIKTTVSGFIDGLAERFSAIGINMQTVTDTISKIWIAFCNILAPVFTGVFALLSNTLTVIFGVITGIVDVFIGLFTGNWSQMWLGIKEIFGSVWDGIVNSFKIIGTMIGGIWDAVCTYFVTVWGVITGMFSGLIESIKTGIINFVMGIPDFFAALPERIGYALGFAIASVYTWYTNMQQLAKDTASGFIDNIKLFFSLLPKAIENLLTLAIQKVIAWKDSFMGKGTESGEGFFESLKTALTNIIPKLWELGGNIVAGVWDGIKSAKDAFLKNVSGFFTGMVDGVKAGLGIHSPSTVFAAIGKWLPPGVVNGFATAMPAAISSIQSFISKGVNSLDAGNVTLGAAVDEQSFGDKIKSTFGNVITVLQSVEQQFYESVSSMTDSLGELLSLGANVVTDGVSLGYVSAGGFTQKASGGSPSVVAEKVTAASNDTFVFYSPEPINEVQAAKLLKETKRDLSEGL